MAVQKALPLIPALASAATGALAAGKAALATGAGKTLVGGLAFGAGKQMASNAFKNQQEESESFTDKIKERGKAAADAGAAYAQANRESQQRMEERGQQMAEKAKAGSQITTGEPMDMSWQMLKAKELKDFLQEYPDINFQSEEVFDDPYTGEPFPYGKTAHGKQSHLSPMEVSAARRTMNPQRMAMLQRYLGRSKAKPTIVQQVHGNVEDPYFVPPNMEKPPMRTETSNPQFENQLYYETLDFDYPYTQEQEDEHNRRYNIQQGEPMNLAWRMLKGELQLPHQITEALRDDLSTLDRAHKMTDTNEGTLIENIHPDMEQVVKLLAEKHLGELNQPKSRPPMPLFHGQFL